MQRRDALRARQPLPGDFQPQRFAVAGDPDPAEQLSWRVRAGKSRALAGKVFGVALLGIARDRGLLISGDSDFHGFAGRDNLGEPPVSYALLERIRETLAERKR